MPVYQEKNKKKIPKNGYSWYFRVYYTDMYGNRKQYQSKMFLTKTDAKKAEREYLNNINKKDSLDENIQFLQVYNDWLEYKKKTLKISTQYGLEKTLNKHLLTFFEKYKLHSIKINVINDWQRKLLTSKLSISKTNEIIGYFKELLNYAIIYYDFDSKVANCFVKVRNDTPKANLKDSEINFWDLNQFNHFISCVDNNYYKLIFSFLYRTGLRLGEFRALTWNDLNLKNKKLRINKSLTNNSYKKGYIITTPKTKNSFREIEIDNNLIKQLIDYKKEVMQLYGFNENWFIFGNINPIAPTTLRRTLNKYIKLANEKKITIHGFRHSHVSLLIYLGCDSRDVAERIGDTIDMVESTYYHMFPEKKKETINKLNNIKF